MTIGEITQGNGILVIDSQDVRALGEHLGVHSSNMELFEEFAFLVTLDKSGADYADVWQSARPMRVSQTAVPLLQSGRPTAVLMEYRKP